MDVYMISGIAFIIIGLIGCGNGGAGIGLAFLACGIWFVTL